MEQFSEEQLLALMSPLEKHLYKWVQEALAWRNIPGIPQTLWERMQRDVRVERLMEMLQRASCDAGDC